jgi:tetratricopeptide (TPR) repeat protein
MEMWRRCGEAVSAGFSAALYSVYSGLYSEAVVSSVASAVALAEVGQFKEAVQYVQRAAKALYEAAREVFEQVKVTVQRLVELFVEAVTRVLAWVDEHKAYLFLMAAVAAGAVALSVALNMWGLVELEKLAHAAVGALPFFAGLADTGGRAAERFRAVVERWRVDENEKKQKIEKVINEVVNAPQKRERPFSKLSSLENLPPPLAELRKALTRVEGEVEKDAAVVAALVLYKTLINNAEAYGEWAELYRWARSLVGREEFTVADGDIKRLRGAQSRLEEAAEEVRRELNGVLVLYSQSDFYKERPDLLNKLKQLLEVDLGEAEELAKARGDELSEFRDVNMGTRAHAALLSVRGEGEQQRLAAAFVKYILRGAEKEGKDVYRKAEEIVKEGMARGSLELGDFEGRVEVGGKEYVVKVIGGGAEFEKSESGKKLLRIRITAEVDGVRSEYTITYGRYSKNAVMGYAYAKGDAPEVREEDAKRLAAVIKTLTGKEPWIRRMKDGTIMIVCGRTHLEGFKHYAELTDAVERWLKETRR